MCNHCHLEERIEVASYVPYLRDPVGPKNVFKVVNGLLRQLGSRVCDIDDVERGLAEPGAGPAGFLVYHLTRTTVRINYFLQGEPPDPPVDDLAYSEPQVDLTLWGTKSDIRAQLKALSAKEPRLSYVEKGLWYKRHEKYLGRL